MNQVTIEEFRIGRAKLISEEIVKKFMPFTDNVRVQLLIDRGINNTHGGSARWVNKLISTDEISFRKNVQILLHQMYTLNNPDVRLYSSLNVRNIRSAAKMFCHKQIDLNDENFNYFYSHIKDEFVSCLMKPENKFKGLWLIDLDTKDTNNLDYVLEQEYRCHIATAQDPRTIFKYETPNGWHYIVNKLDTRIIDVVTNAEVKGDGLLLLHCLEI